MSFRQVVGYRELPSLVCKAVARYSLPPSLLSTGPSRPSGSLRSRPRDHVHLHNFWHASHLSHLPRPYTNLTREVGPCQRL